MITLLGIEEPACADGRGRRRAGHRHDDAHRARPLRADRADIASYVLVLSTALVRVGVPLLQPAWNVGAVLASAALWSAGFGLYALRYAPMLLRPRLDGRPG